MVGKTVICIHLETVVLEKFVRLEFVPQEFTQFF